MGKIEINGYVKEDIQSWREKFKNTWRVAFGNNVRIDDESPQGAFSNDLAQKTFVLEEMAQYLVNGLDIDTAIYNQLIVIGSMNGIYPKKATKSTLFAKIITRNNLSIPANTKFQTIDGKYEYENINEVTSSFNNVEMVAVATGTNLGVASGTKLQTVEVINDIVDIEIVTFNQGSDIEDVESFRKRLKSRDEQVREGTNEVDSLVATFKKNDKVKSVIIYENDTDKTDTVTSVPAHSLEVVLESTLSDNEIAQIILNDKSGGTGTFGTTQITLPDTQGISKVISFSRGVEIPCKVTVEIDSIDGKELAGDINDKIIKSVEEYFFGLEIGEDISISRVNHSITHADHNLEIISLSIAKVSGTDGTINIPIGLKEFGSIEASKITISKRVAP